MTARPTAYGNGNARPRRPAFATVIAIFLIGLAAVAFAAVATVASHDGRRTRRAAADAQVRQLLLAGAADAVAGARAWGVSVPPREWSVALPTPLAGDGASLKLKAGPAPSGDAGAAEVRVEAVAAGRRGGQTLRFRREGAIWSLADVESDGPAVDAKATSPR